MRDDGFGPSLHDDSSFEDEANVMVQGMAKANAISVIAGAVGGIASGWAGYALSSAEVGFLWAVAIGLVIGLIGFYLTTAIVGTILVAQVFGGDSE